MFAKTVERWEESKKYLMEKDRVLQDKRQELNAKVKAIFKLSETNFSDSAFDWEGDNDLLKLNFGGRNLDIKRSVFSKPKFGWNLFSCLFEKRWDAFHVRDKTGRIYVDLREEWYRPLIEYMKYNDSGTDPIPSNIFLDVSLNQLFNDDTTFSFPEAQVTGAFRSRILTKENINKMFSEEISEESNISLVPLYPVNDDPFYCPAVGDKKGEVDDKLNDDHLEYLKLSEKNKVDLRYKTLLYIYEPTRDNRSYLVFSEAWVKTDDHQPFGFLFSQDCSESFTIEVEEETKDNAKDSTNLFPIHFDNWVKEHQCSYSTSVSLREKPCATEKDTACNRIEVFEVRYVHDVIYPPKLNLSEEKLTVPAVEKDLKPNGDLMDDFMREFIQNRSNYRREMELLEMKVKKFDQEMMFMAGYFFICWLNGGVPKSAEARLFAVVEEKKKFEVL
jgi:hypothetical protein